MRAPFLASIFVISGKFGLSSGGEKRDPMDIVRERYARGEITREQLEQMKKDLS